MDNIIEKIEKCLRLANSDNPNEAAAALQAAVRLAEKHGLDLAEIEMTVQNKTAEEVLFDIKNEIVGVRNWLSYEVKLSCILQTVFHVSVIRCGPTMRAIGITSDILIFKAVFDILRKQIAKEAKNIHGKGKWSILHSSYAIGYIASLYERLIKTKDEDKLNNNALVIVNKDDQVKKAVTDFYPDARTSRNRKMNVDTESYLEGRSSGMNCNLNFKNILED